MTSASGLVIIYLDPYFIYSYVMARPHIKDKLVKCALHQEELLAQNRL